MRLYLVEYDEIVTRYAWVKAPNIEAARKFGDSPGETSLFRAFDDSEWPPARAYSMRHPEAKMLDHDRFDDPDYTVNADGEIIE